MFFLACFRRPQGRLVPPIGSPSVNKVYLLSYLLNFQNTSNQYSLRFLFRVRSHLSLCKVMCNDVSLNSPLNLCVKSGLMGKMEMKADKLTTEVISDILL